MKKILILTAVLAMISLGAQAEKYITMGAIPAPATGVTTFSNGTANVLVPKIVYTDLTGTITNVLTAAYVPSVSTNAADTGKTYRLASFTQTGGAETMVKFNTPGASNDTGGVILLPGDKFTLTGTQTNLTFTRVLFEVK